MSTSTICRFTTFLGFRNITHHQFSSRGGTALHMSCHCNQTRVQYQASAVRRGIRPDMVYLSAKDGKVSHGVHRGADSCVQVSMIHPHASPCPLLACSFPASRGMYHCGGSIACEAPVVADVSLILSVDGRARESNADGTFVPSFLRFSGQM